MILEASPDNDLYSDIFFILQKVYVNVTNFEPL